MKFYDKTIEGIVDIATPLVHGQILGEREKDPQGENNMVRFRKYYFMLKKDGIKQNVGVYSISGNAVRGIGRRRLFQYMFSKVLDININDVLSDYDEMTRRYITNLFWNGGSSPSNSQSSGGTVSAEVYDEVLRDLPMLDLLGGVLVTHHFSGHTSVGIMFPRTQETKAFFVDQLDYFKPRKGDDDLPTLDRLNVFVSRHSRVQSNKDASTSNDKSLSKAEQDNRKSAGIYGAELLSPGVNFYWKCQLNDAVNEGTYLAFLAFVALVAEKGKSHLGGMNNKGYGDVVFHLDDFDPEKSKADFRDWLLEHKEDVIRGLRLLASDFKYKLDNGDKKKGGKGKKPAKKEGEADAE